MPKVRKSSEDHDPKTERGRAGLSLLRNRGADRVLKQVQKYQEASQHKVRFSVGHYMMWGLVMGKKEQILPPIIS